MLCWGSLLHERLHMNTLPIAITLRCPFCQYDNKCMSVSANRSVSSPEAVQNVMPLKADNDLSQDALYPDNLSDMDKQTGCWCFVQKIPHELIDLVPLSSKGQRCICAACVEYFTRDPVGFSSRYCSE
tara:strand:- start:80356 stop:80739 length:384 start_codon:yes stop_codon:yes gene_type:complete